MGNPPFEDVSPIENAMLVYQRVSKFFSAFKGILSPAATPKRSGETVAMGFDRSEFVWPSFRWKEKRNPQKFGSGMGKGIGNCRGQQKCGKHRILGQSVVTCRCCSFSPFIRKMMKHVRNMFQLGSSTTCQRMLPGVATRVLGGKRHLAAIWLRAATKLNGGSKQQRWPHQQGIQQGIHKYHNETSGQNYLVVSNIFYIIPTWGNDSTN